LPHSKLSRTGKIVQETAEQPETTHKPLTFANLGRIELGSGLAHPVVSDAGTNFFRALMGRLGDCAVNWKLM
jgi:hypothetical protein